jgi:hypothetical protein
VETHLRRNKVTEHKEWRTGALATAIGVLLLIQAIVIAAVIHGRPLNEPQACRTQFGNSIECPQEKENEQ